MPEQSLDLARRAFSAFNRRDVEDLLELAHPEIEWRPMRASQEGVVYRGHEGVHRALADVAAEFEELRNDPREYLASADSVVVSGRLVAKERRTGVRLDRHAAWVCTIRDGLIWRMTAYPDRESALEDAGARAPATEP